MDFKIKLEKKDQTFVCQGCKKPVSGETHTCPFSEEIHGDCESQCNCCSDCEYGCAMDI